MCIYSLHHYEQVSFTRRLDAEHLELQDPGTTSGTSLSRCLHCTRFHSRDTGTQVSPSPTKLLNPSFIPCSLRVLQRAAMSHTKVQIHHDARSHASRHLHPKFLGSKNNLLCPAFEHI